MEEAVGMRAVVEHPVLFKMPRLRADAEQEKLILDALKALKTNFPDIVILTTGRLLKEHDNCTHAIFVRFPSQQALIDYYSSDDLMGVIEKMLPALSGEYTVDYTAFVKDVPTSNYNTAVVHISFLRIHEGTSDDVISSLISKLYGLAEEMNPIVLGITAGSNNYIRDKVFSHAFVAHLASEDVLDEFYNHPSYLKIMKDEILPICSKILSVDLSPH